MPVLIPTGSTLRLGPLDWIGPWDVRLWFNGELPAVLRGRDIEFCTRPAKVWLAELANESLELVL